RGEVRFAPAPAGSRSERDGPRDRRSPRTQGRSGSAAERPPALRRPPRLRRWRRSASANEDGPATGFGMASPRIQRRSSGQLSNPTLSTRFAAAFLLSAIFEIGIGSALSLP